MKLLLTSNGLVNDSIVRALQQMLDRPIERAKLVFVTTGSNPVRGDKSWLANDIRHAQKLGWAQFEIIDVAVTASWPKAAWWPVFEEADAIMFCGGHAHYLSYWLQKSGLMAALPDLLKTKVYIGISAGSIVATMGMQTSSGELAKLQPGQGWAHDKIAPEGQESTKTLGLTNFLFRPHFNSPRFPAAKEGFMRQIAKQLKLPIYVVDDESAVRVIGNQAEVISEGRWLLLGGHPGEGL
jgi:dipeptidase E